MLTVSEANKARPEYVKKFFDFAQEIFDDVGMISSNSFNFPILFDGKEAFVEVVVKIPKSEDDENYAKREEYQLKLREAERKAAETAEKKRKKMEADEKRRKEAKERREKATAANAEA